VIFYLNKTYESIITNLNLVDKEDLELVNHLSGRTQKYLKLSFKNVTDLMQVRSELLPLIKKNKENKESNDGYAGWINKNDHASGGSGDSNFLSKIIDIREYDVPYHVRCCIDNEIRCSFWYDVLLDGPLAVKLTH
jgi:DNA polymerase epsilon subunit 1